MSLTGKTLAASYKDLLQVDNSNSGVTTSLKQVKDGEGTGSALLIADDQVHIFPQNDDTSDCLTVKTTRGDNVLSVDTTNELVSASGNYVNTNYQTFFSDAAEGTANIAGYHYPLSVFSSPDGGLVDQLNAFGNGTDPATTVTFADAADQKASLFVPVMWYVPDAISIDSVTSIEGADAATGDTTRMHLMSYTFTSGSTSALSSGALLAHNSDVTNAGSEQAYLSSWTVDSAAVTAGKVIVATFESDSINSDYSYNVIIKYHLV